MSNFEKMGFKFQDERMSSAEKQPWVYGVTDLGDMNIDIFGPSDNVVKVILYTLEVRRITHQGYLFTLTLFTMPEPDCRKQMVDWFTDEFLQDAFAGKRQETTCGKARVILQSTQQKNGVLMILTIEALK